MELISINKSNVKDIAPLLISFRKTLSLFNNINYNMTVDDAICELNEYLDKDYPIYAIKEDDKFIAYEIIKIDGTCVWLEHIYVDEKYRKKGAASILFDVAEKKAKENGEDTIFNNVHPNNDAMIGFLKSKGYTVLNMIEIRKEYNNEKLRKGINVGKNKFDY